MSSSLDAKSALLRVGHRRLSSAIGSMRKMSQGMMPTINLQMRETMSDEELAALRRKIQEDMLAEAEEKVYREQAKRKCLTLLNDQLLRAAKSNNLKMARAALKDGADINHQDSLGYSAVMHATCKGSERVLRFLCAKGASTNLVSKQGCTALVMAARDDNLEVARALMGSRARKSQRTTSGRTALHCAAACNSTRVAELMLNGQTSSQKGGVAFISRMAVEDVNAVDNAGATALHEAALQDHR